MTTPSSVITATYDAEDRLQKFGDNQYSYNAHGDLSSKLENTTGKATTYQYTSLNQLKTVTVDGNTIEYIIDGENHRVGKKVNGTVKAYWVYDGQGRIVAELNEDGSLRSRFVYASQANSPDYMIRGGVEYYYTKDHLGSVLSVMNISTGTRVQMMRYSDFGDVTSDTNPGFQPFGFAGGQYDPDTRLVRFGARDYDPSTGRWLSKDPILFGGRDTNLYGYVMNDPINLIDPSGLLFENIIADKCSPNAQLGLGAAMIGIGGMAVRSAAASFNIWGMIAGGLVMWEGGLNVSKARARGAPEIPLGTDGIGDNGPGGSGSGAVCKRAETPPPPCNLF